MTAARLLTLALAALGLLSCEPQPQGQAPLPSTAPDAPLLAPVELPADPPSADAPILVLLHGYGSNENDLLPLGRAFDPRLRVIALRGPVDLGDGRFAWFPGEWKDEAFTFDPADARSAVESVIQSLETLGHKGSIFVAGFSQGAMLAGEILRERPDLVDGVLLFSGRGLPHEKFVGRLDGERVFAAHGASDPVISFADGEANALGLERQGAEVELMKFDGRHTIPPAVRKRAGEWLQGRLGE